MLCYAHAAEANQLHLALKHIMPKKTRREKILAQLHRKTLEIKSPQVTHVNPSLPLQTATSPYIFQPQAATTRAAVLDPSDVIEYKAIKTDLAKTLMLAAIAIGVELLLYLKTGR